MFLVDAHLDLSYNALRGREVLRPASEQKADEEGIPSVGLPDLRRGNVGLICATIFVMPAYNGKQGYTTAAEAYDTAQRHLQWYQTQELSGAMRLVRSRAGVPGKERIENKGEMAEDREKRIEDRARPDSSPSSILPPLPSSILYPLSSAFPPLSSPPPSPLPAILLLEGADPIRTPDDVQSFHDAGVRIVGLAWRQTRYAGGTGAPGPLTPEGIQLIPELDRCGIIHDASHLAEESFWQLLDLTRGPVIASHSNCRAIVPTDRQLSDAMIKAIAGRGGVIGINFFDRFLLEPASAGQRRASLSDVVRHIRHICDLTGSADHAAIGTDMDGGLGREEIPIEIASSADLPKIADTLNSEHFSDEDVQKIMGGNWMGFFARHLH